MSKSWDDYVYSDDLEGAIERYNGSTSRWKDHWWNCILTIFKANKEWAKKYILDPVAQTISKIVEEIKQAIGRRGSIRTGAHTIQWGEVEIDFLNGTDAKDTKSGEKTYFFKFYDRCDAPPVFDKIGTTTKSCLGRLKEEIRYYNKAGFDIERVEVCEIWDCGNTPAESYESFMRALLIKKYPNTWHKNDRFFGTNIPTELFTSLCKQYAAL